MPQRIGPLRPFRRAGLARRTILPCLLLALLELDGAADAQDRQNRLRDVGPGLDLRGPVGVLQVEPSLRLEGVVPRELLAAGSARALAAPTWRPHVRSAGDFELDTRVVRSVPAVWRMFVEDLASAAELSVRCDVTGDGGEIDALTHGNDPRSVVRVRVRPLAPHIVTNQADGVVVEGGVVLDMDLRDVRTAGAHGGTLTVTVEHF